MLILGGGSFAVLVLQHLEKGFSFRNVAFGSAGVTMIAAGFVWWSRTTRHVQTEAAATTIFIRSGWIGLVSGIGLVFRQVAFGGGSWMLWLGIAGIVASAATLALVGRGRRSTWSAERRGE